MVEEIKGIINRQLNNIQISDIQVATVVSVNPISIQISDKLIVEEENIVLCREVTEYEVEMTVNHTTDTASINVTAEETAHSHTVPIMTTNNTDIAHTHTVASDDGTVTTSGETPSSAHGHTVPKHTTDDGGFAGSGIGSHTHPYTGRKTWLVHKQLLIGEKVIAIKKLGGQKYFIVDRLG